jgi:hypothetical protein
MASFLRILGLMCVAACIVQSGSARILSSDTLLTDRQVIADTLLLDGQSVGADTARFNGQVIRPDSLVQHVQDDTLGVAVVDGIQGQMQELGALRRVEEAGVVGESQDGIVTMEIDGLIVDETITRIGRDFYEEFYRLWQRPPDAVNFTVVVGEQPMPSMGTRIIVRVNDEIAFQGQLQPRAEMIESAAWQGVGFTYRFVQGLSSRQAVVY